MDVCKFRLIKAFAVRLPGTQQTQRVDDVETFPGHIACAASTQSELVVLCYDHEGQLIAVLDIDSDQPAFFTKAHQDFCEDLLRSIFG